MKNVTIISALLVFADNLKHKQLFFLIGGLFLLDLIIPDFIPFVDEILLGLLTVLLANWKKEKAEKVEDGHTIEGEVINEPPDNEHK